jgi:hypothetical protein
VIPLAAPAGEPSFDMLGKLAMPWTAQLALDLLPEPSGPKIEIIRGDSGALLAGPADARRGAGVREDG